MTTLGMTSQSDLSAYYTLCHTVKYQIELGCYGSYGVIARDREGKLIRRIEDISTDSACVLRLVRLLNGFRVSYCHIQDILEDFFALL